MTHSYNSCRSQDNWLQRGILGANPVTTSRATGLSAATTGAVAVAVAMAPNSRTAYKNALVGLGSGYAVSAASTFNDNRAKVGGDGFGGRACCGVVAARWTWGVVVVVVYVHVGDAARHCSLCSM